MQVFFSKNMKFILFVVVMLDNFYVFADNWGQNVFLFSSVFSLRGVINVATVF